MAVNNVVLVGTLTADPEIRRGQGENAYVAAQFSLAVNRSFKNKDGNYDADFPRIVAYGKNAEFAEKYFKKGTSISVIGEIRTGSYTNKDGVKVYTTDVQANQFGFVGKKSDGTTNTQAKPNTDFMNIPANVEEEELPF